MRKQTFEEFHANKNKTIYPPTEKYPDGYVGVMVYEEEYYQLIGGKQNAQEPNIHSGN